MPTDPLHSHHLDQIAAEEGTDMGSSERIEPASMTHMELTGAVLSCAFEVAKELGTGFVESVYERAMIIALAQKDLSVTRQQPVAVTFRGHNVGDFCADLLVEQCVIVELKAVKALVPEHQAQVINYLNATGMPVGLLINFGAPRIEYKRFTRRKNMDRQDGQDWGRGHPETKTAQSSVGNDALPADKSTTRSTTDPSPRISNASDSPR
jgi:GxxExxY protein